MWKLKMTAVRAKLGTEEGAVRAQLDSLASQPLPQSRAQPARTAKVIEAVQASGGKGGRRGKSKQKNSRGDAGGKHAAAAITRPPTGATPGGPSSPSAPPPTVRGALGLPPWRCRTCNVFGCMASGQHTRGSFSDSTQLAWFFWARVAEGMREDEEAFWGTGLLSLNLHVRSSAGVSPRRLNTGSWRGQPGTYQLGWCGPDVGNDHRAPWDGHCARRMTRTVGLSLEQEEAPEYRACRWPRPPPGMSGPLKELPRSGTAVFIHGFDDVFSGRAGSVEVDLCYYDFDADMLELAEEHGLAEWPVWVNGHTGLATGWPRGHVHRWRHPRSDWWDRPGEVDWGWSGLSLEQEEERLELEAHRQSELAQQYEEEDDFDFGDLWVPEDD